MIKLKESGCGCSLRTGTLIIFWSTLVLDSIRSLLYFAKLIYDPSYSYFLEQLPIITIFFDTIFLTSCIFGTVMSTLGIYAIQKNRQDFLNLCYYYYLVYAGYWLVIILVIIIYPSAFYEVTIISPLHLFLPFSGVIRFALVYALAYFFLAVFTLYMAVIVKNCKENMKNNALDNFDPEMPDPTTIGYSSSI